MTTQLSSLKELQKIDVEMVAARSKVAAFDPQIEVIEEPALALESEVTTLRNRLQEIQVDERRVERNADEKRERSKKLDERLAAVRNVREEAAVHAEIDMLRRSLEGAEQEALTLLDQIRRMEERLEETEAALEVAQAEVGPKRDELIEQRDAAQGELAELESRRDMFASGITSKERDIYERILAGGREIAVADLTEDGACGHCFSIIPLQLQNQILHGDEMIRCEGCGVILTPTTPEELAAQKLAAEQAAAEQAAAAERAAAEESEAEEPEAEEEMVEEAAAEELTAEEPAAEEAEAEEPAAEEAEAGAEEPEAEEPIAEVLAGDLEAEEPAAEELAVG